MRQDVRPDRPDDEDAPQLSDAVWELAQSCWLKDPKRRITANTACDIIAHVLATATVTPPKPVPSSSHPVIIHQSMPQPPTPARASVPHAPIPLQDLTQLLRTTSVNAQPISIHSPSHSNFLTQTKSLPPVPVQANLPSPLTHPLHLTMRGHTDTVYCAAFSQNGKYIASGSGDYTVMVWDAQTGNPAFKPLKLHNRVPCCVAFSPDGTRIASGSLDSTIQVWNIATQSAVVGRFSGPRDSIWSVCFSPSGKQIASCSRDMTIWVWDAQTARRLVGPLTGHSGAVNSVVFSADGKHLISASSDCTVRVWDAISGISICGPLGGDSISIYASPKYFAAFSPDGQSIISASTDGNVCVWNTVAGALLSGPSKRHEEGALAVVFTPQSTYSRAVSPDGKWIADTGAASGIVQVWDSGTGLLAKTFTGHTGSVRSVSFSPDSKRVLSASSDKTIRVHTLGV